MKFYEFWVLKEEKKKLLIESLFRFFVGVGVVGSGRVSRRRFWVFREGRG